MVTARLTKALNAPVDAVSLHVFRFVFGVLMAVAGLRFFTHGWIAADYAAPRVFFHYWGFGWVQPLPAAGMACVYAAIVVSALCIALGVVYRPACVVFALGFGYAHLCDKSNYLNHYYLISLLSLWLAFLPARGAGTTRAWILWLFRFQFAVVYVFGGIGKLGADWLWHAEPLRLWLSANVELWRGFDWPWVATLFSVCGALFDLGIVPMLLWRRCRPFAYAVVVVFHVLTAALFRIGMFPWLMMAGATLFFDPAWPRRFIRFPSSSLDGVAAPRALLLCYCALQLLLPLRAWLYPGNTLWSEEGFRFAWRVMLIEKSGRLEYTVVDEQGRSRIVEPREYLTPFQARMASTQPDMILELAHVIARETRAKHVFADAEVSFNGRRHAPLIDTRVDLAAEEDSLAPKGWILPAPTGAPEF